MFENFFDENNVVWRTINRIADIIILNIIFILCCLPIVTIGASVTALYTVTLRLSKDKDTYVVKGFFNAFKSNFKQSTIIWLIMLAIGVLLASDWYLSNIAALSFSNILNYVFVLFSFCYLMIISYVFPVQCKFENKVSATIINSALMGIGHFVPWTVLIMLLNIAPILLIFLSSSASVVLVPVMILCGFAIIAYVNSMIFQKIFEKHLS